MAPPKPKIPPAAKPKYGNVFDAWNSSSTGHQRAENKTAGSSGWRLSRTAKLANQFKGGAAGGGKSGGSFFSAASSASSSRPAEQLIAYGAKGHDEKLAVSNSKEAREKKTSGRGIGDMLVTSQIKKPGSGSAGSEDQKKGLTAEEKLNLKRKREDDDKEEERKLRKVEKKIFDGLTVYVNGSTHPLISDHRLKHVLAENGGKVSIHLGRKSVTHVILGTPANGAGVGAGGGLAGGKMQKEIMKVGGRGIKYVGVEWVLESIKAGKRLPEASFSNLRVAAKGQSSVYSMFTKSESTKSAGSDESKATLS